MKAFWEKKSRIFVVMMLVLILGVALFGVSQNAATTNNYKINVVDDGSTQEENNEDVSVSQKIVSSTDTELTFQVDFENYLYRTTQVALVVDNSFSMWSEDKLTNSKQAIIDLVNSLFDEVENVEVSLTTYDGTKVAMGTNKDEIINQINNITAYNGVTTKTGLTYAQETFTQDDANKYIVIYTDGEENISDTIQNISNQKIALVTAYYGKSNFISKQYQKAGSVYTINSVTNSNLASVNSQIMSKVKAKMVKEVNNINIENAFSSEIANNFTFELTQDPSSGTISYSNSGYTWHISSLTKKSKASFKYTLKLKNNIDRNIMYKDINTNNTMNVTYNNNQDSETGTLENTNTPVINIVESFSLKIKAINKKYTGINARNIEFKIEKMDQSGNVLSTETKKTNTNGEIILSGMTENGTYIYRLTQMSTPTSYEPLEESKKVKTITINKDFASNQIIATTSDSDDVFSIETNQDDKVVTATVKMDPREFILNITKIDEEYKTPLQNAEFSLAEPQGEAIPKNTTVDGKTNVNGKIALTGEVAGEGTYTYTLSEKTSPTGYYENTEEVPIKITFDENGTPTKVDYNSDFITSDAATLISGDTINLTVTNRMLDYTLKVEALNKKYNNIKISDVRVKITGRNSSGAIVYENEQVTENGEVNLTINKYGTVTYTIEQLSAPAEYNTTENVSFTVTRDFETNDITLNSPTGSEDFVFDNTKKLLTAKIYLDPKTFDFKVNKIDKDYPTVKLDGATITLKQTAGRENLQDTTTTDGYVTFKADVICSKDNNDGTYTATYTLQEDEKPTGYQQLKSQVQVKVTFDNNGKVINAESLNTEYVEIVDSNSKVEVNLKNERQTYSVQVQAKHKNYTDVPIANVGINITGTSNGNTFLSTTSLTTDQDGNTVSIEKLKQDGTLEFTLEETSVPVRIC